MVRARAAKYVGVEGASRGKMPPMGPERKSSLGARIILAVASALLTAAVLYLLAPAQVGFFIWTLTHDERPLGIHMHHPRYCYRHIPSSSVLHSTSEFSVRYTIDEQGSRVTPSPSGEPPQVVLLGCSFTFGDGVQDRETYASLLGQQRWARYKIRNMAVMGWGTVHSKLALEDVLAGTPSPRAVIYGWIGPHVDRAGSPQYCRNTHSYRMEHPSAGDEGSTAEDLLRANARLIGQMNEAAAARRVPFFVALLSSHDQDQRGERAKHATMIVLLRKQRVPTIDLSEVGRDMFYTVDHHPTRDWHRAVAGALARSPRLARLLEGPTRGTRR